MRYKLVMESSVFSQKKLKIELPQVPAALLADLYTKDTCVYVTLVTILRKWNRPMCPPEEWIAKLQKLYRKGFYSAIEIRKICRKMSRLRARRDKHKSSLPHTS